MFSNPKFIILLRNLLEASIEGKVQWEETPVEESFRVFLGSAIVRVSRTFDEVFERTCYSVVLVDQDGKSLDEITTGRTDDEGEQRLLIDLFEVARRRALDVDGLLDGLIQSLNKKR